jgi:DNA-binding transcriptional ArsR family regulator
MSPADENPLQPGFVPEPLMLISSAETLRALSDPTRMRLLEVMVQRQDPAWSVKELASALAVPTTRLYHHVEQLLAHGIVVPVEQRVVSGIIETRYRVAALSFQLDRRLFEGDPGAASQASHDALVTIFDAAREEIEAAMRSAVETPPQVGPDGTGDGILVVRSVARLSPARAAEYRRRLTELQAAFDDDADAADATPWGVLLTVYPMPPTTKEPTDG